MDIRTEHCDHIFELAVDSKIFNLLSVHNREGFTDSDDEMIDLFLQNDCKKKLILVGFIDGVIFDDSPRPDAYTYFMKYKTQLKENCFEDYTITYVLVKSNYTRDVYADYSIYDYLCDGGFSVINPDDFSEFCDSIRFDSIW
jgi:hypothetical protein